MNNIIKIILYTLNGKDNTKSSVRLQSYFVLLPILIISGLFIIIEAVNAILSWKTGTKYIPTNEFLGAYAMLLAHHISVLFSRQKSENKEEVPSEETNTEEVPSESNIEEEAK